jgi:hypothetical protein
MTNFNVSLDSEAESDLEHARNTAIHFREEMQRIQRDAMRLLWAIVIAQGGELKVPYQLLVVPGGRLSQTDDFESNSIVFKADMGIGEDLTKR